MKTLETIVRELKEKGIQDTEISAKIHAASLLAFFEASHSVVNGTTMPTPLYRLTYDDQNHNLQFQTLEGKAPVPREGSLDVGALDLLIGSLLREKMPLLLEGRTGVGKTYTVEQFFKAILPSGNYKSIRLNANMDNILQPFTRAEFENGLLKTFLKTEELEKIAVYFVDEANRADSNKTLQLQDGEVRLGSGERGELGIPIPVYVEEQEGNGSFTWKVDGKRPLFFVSAQNPPQTKDAKYSGARRTDAAQNSRNLQIDIPNTASAIGSSVLLLNNGNGQHAEFMETYRGALARNLGIKADTLDTLAQDWISMYAFTTDPKKTYCPNIQSSLEFLDAVLGIVSPDLKADFEHEKAVSAEWSDALKAHKIDFTYTSTLEETAAAMGKVRDVVQSFEEELITRDIVKVKKLSDALSLIRRLESAESLAQPAESFERSAKYITVQDTACALAIMLHDKQEKHNVSAVPLIDTMLNEYTGIAQSFAQQIGYKQPFRADDPNMAVYNLAFQHAIQSTGKQSLADKVRATTGSITNSYVHSFIDALGASTATLKRLEEGKEFRKPILARMIADLATLAGFANQYSSEAEEVLKNSESTKEKIIGMKNLYQEKRKTGSIPDIYLQRLPRVLGV